MNPQSISEKLMYSTILIETSNGRGTGFFFNFTYGNNITVPIILTNKHVINDKKIEKVSITLHIRDKDGNFKNGVFQGNIDWNFHSTKDLCFCYAMPIINAVEKDNEGTVFYMPIGDDLIIGNEKLNELSAVEDVLMVGYPIGLSDKINNYPVFRRGITSSHPALSFNSDGIGIVDIACFPGSSGSPIFILNEGSYGDKRGNLYIGNSRLIFLGILFAGPIFNAQGELEIIEIPTTQQSIVNVPLMVNLGYYIKASEILEFKNEIDIIVKKEHPLTNNNQTI